MTVSENLVHDPLLAEALKPPAQDDDICPKTGKQHRPDWRTVNIESDGEEVYADVNCLYCGRSGCVGTVKLLEETIQW